MIKTKGKLDGSPTKKSSSYLQRDDQGIRNALVIIKRVGLKEQRGKRDARGRLRQVDEQSGEGGKELSKTTTKDEKAAWSSTCRKQNRSSQGTDTSGDEGGKKHRK